MLKSLPVVMYHSVHPWFNKGLVVSPELFAEHCRAMVNAGWRAAGLAEAEDYLLRGKPLPAKTAWLTFDDGYLDNYIYAWPILRKYGLKATVFATVGLLEEGGPARSSLLDVWEGKCRPEDLVCAENPMRRHPELGFEERRDRFLNWDEVRLMQSSGVLDTAAHSLWHDKVFCGPEYQQVFQPGRRERTFDRVRGPIPWGLPRFAIAPALAGRAFIPSQGLLDAVGELVPQDKVGAAAFFHNEDKRAQLKRLLAGFAPEELGRLESETDMWRRWEEEFARCKARLEQETGRPALTFCWPWGKFSPLAREAAGKVGFKVFVTTALGANRPGKPDAVKRMNIKVRSAASLLRRLNLYAHPVRADIYQALQFRWKLKLRS